ncbi:hypothetical protein BSKO_02448 [Bryopsis sp. KO-2023]|nr:hypothetical protein BSKO_02448 [Bryopsis sp. KO-2023]
MLRLKVLHACIGKMLEPLKELSFSGISLVDPNGRAWTVYPRMLSWVADNPEQSDLLCKYQAHAAHMPCVQCDVQNGFLDSIDAATCPLTELRQCNIVDEIAELLKKGSKKEGKEKMKEHSLFPIRSSLYGFADSNIHRAIGCEELHDMQEGVFIYILHALPSLLPADIANDRFNKIPRYPGVAKPTIKDYIRKVKHNEGHGFVSAKEHGGATFLLPFACSGLNPCVDDLLCLHADIESIKKRNRYPLYMSESELENLRQKIMEWDSLMHALIEQLKPAGLKTRKYHKEIRHLVSQIAALGTPAHWDSNSFERHHKHVKRHYRASSKRTRMGKYQVEIVQQEKEYQAFRQLSEGHMAISGVKRTYESAMSLAERSESHQFGSCFINIHLGLLLEGVPVGVSSRTAQNTLDLKTTQPEVEELSSLLEHFAASENIQVQDILSVYSVAVLYGVYFEGQDPVYQTVRASPSFHGAELFSDVAVEIEHEGCKQIEYGQIRLLFSIKVGDDIAMDLLLLRCVVDHRLPEMDEDVPIAKLWFRLTAVAGYCARENGAIGEETKEFRVDPETPRPNVATR